MEPNRKKGILKRTILLLMTMILIISSVITLKNKVLNEDSKIVGNSELQRAMTYDQFVDGDEDIEGTDNVKFSAFFLRDLDGDGYAEKIKGTCKHIATDEDTLYMEINVLTEGYLKDAKVQIDGKNFYLQTTLPKDNELKDDYIGSNIKTIEFENLNNGTQKLLIGVVRSGDYTYSSTKKAAIGNNINNYSREDNTITLTGTYVAEDGTETEITKQIPIIMDWYGETGASISSGTQNYYDIANRIDEENGTLTLTFGVNTIETKDQLNISKNYVQGTIPELNGYAPTSVTLKSGVGTYTYDETTRIFTITKTAETNDEGTITSSLSRYLYNTIEVVYPIEAYTSIGTEMVTIKVPVSTYYEGYNNPNDEFDNPYKSNNATATLVANYMPEKGSVASFEIKVGKYISSPYYHYMISKRKPLRLYNEISSEETNDTYVVMWKAYTGTDGETEGLVLKETKDNETQKVDTFIKSDSSEDSMEDITTNVGIYFSNATSMLGEDGEIKVYDEDTGILVHTFTSSDWNRYTSSNPYKYDTAIKHVKIVTSSTNKETTLYVYNIKELDDEKIIETYTKDEFDTLSYIESNLVMYLGDTYQGSKVHQAHYEAPYSLSTISLSKNVISTQSTEEGLNIYVKSTADESINQIEWTNGEYLIKLPDEVLSLKINSVEINNTSVNINSYEYVENTNGKFIKIKTSNINPASYTITINVDITADPRNASATKDITLYAKNEEGENYYYSGQDIYDIDSDGKVEELVNVRNTSISMIAPNSLLTNQTMSEYDEEQSIVVSPEVAELKPIYGDDTQEKQTVKIGAQIKNNYSSTISEVLMLGKIPFEGNTYVLSGGDLSSDFSTTMTNAGITVPTELQDSVTVYYSTNENPSKDITDTNNGWTLAEDVTDWTAIKTWLVDFEDTIIEQGAEYVFYYTVEIPYGVEFNKVAYSHHGIYFSLDTAEGKYRTQTEPNKIGVMIADKYNLLLTKYQKDNTKLIEGATYRVSKLDDEGNIEESQTAITNSDGTLEMANLYAEKVYEIKEIQSQTDYELNEDIIKIIGHISRDTGILTVEKTEGTIRDDLQIIKNDGEDYKVQVKVEDEVKAKLKITKYEEGTTNVISGVRYKITGSGLPDSGKNVSTNVNGEISLSGIKIGEEYTLEEIKAEGYYINNAIKFSIISNNGTYELNVTEGTIKTSTITLEDSLPIANIEIEDEKIPTYNLIINKIEKGTGIEGIEAISISGAKFKLYKEDKEIGKYETDSEGHITISGLYQYEEDKDIDQTYVLKETYAPEGYAKTKDITFKGEVVEGELKLISEDTENYSVDGTTINLIIEDSKSFKLVKKDGETSELLPNVKFAIYNVDEGQQPARNSKGEIIGTKETIDGVEYYTVTTNANGEITADLPEGIYKAVEIEAEEKYDIENQEQYFGIGASREGKSIYIPEYATSIGGTSEDQITSVSETADGGYIVGGYFYSSSIEVGEYTLTNAGTSYTDGMLIKYSSSGAVEWAQSVGGKSEDQITSVSETADGGYIVGGYFYSSSIEVGEYTLTNAGCYDGMLIKYSSSGAVEWAQSVGGTSHDYIRSVSETEDGGYILGGYFYSSIEVGEYTLTNAGYYDGMLIKYSSSGAVEWAQSVGGTNEDRIQSVSETADGGYIVGGYFYSSSIEVGEYTLTNKRSGYSDGMIIKYSSSGAVEWAQSVGGTRNDYIYSVSETADGGYIVGGDFQSTSLEVGEYTLTNAVSTSYSDGTLIKYSSSGAVEWAQSVGGTRSDSIRSVSETADGGYIVGGYFYSSSLEVGEYTLTNAGSTSYTDGMVIKINTYMGAPEQEEITFENTRKEYKITTDIKEIDGVKGGSISGEDLSPYEKVKYGDTSTKQIIMTPDTDYEIIGITVNGNDWTFEELSDGSYIMPQFENVTENKHIVVTYSLKDNKITINKVDSVSGEKLSDVEFGLDQIEERTEPDNNSIIGTLTDNGQEYTNVVVDTEITSGLGSITNNGTYYFVENTDGSLVPTNSKTYQVANVDGATTGVKSSTANSYVEIDLTEKTGTYAVVVNAYCSSEGSDYGYATITSNTTAPTHSSTTGRFMHVSGTVNEKDYISAVLEGGSKYYLHLGYRKDGSVDTGEDQVVINSIKLYSATENSTSYSFVNNAGIYESTNQGVDSTVCNSYIPIDMTGYSGKYNITVNAEVSTASGDYGYATLTQSTTAPSYSSSTGRIVYITNTQSAKDYTMEIDGGYQYYLHLGYYKNATTNTSGDDIFKVNSINISLSDSELYHTTVTTNSEGQAITQIPFGKYSVTEISTQDGYWLLENPEIVEFRSTEGAVHEFTISNEKKAKVIVHHYIKDTETKLAEDEEILGKIGEEYETSPNLDIEKYTLEKDQEGKYIIPSNANGTYTYEDIEVTYYYVEKEIPLTVHHYIEGTENKVPMLDGSTAEDVVTSGQKGTTYTTEAIEDSLLDERYELSETPSNASGTYGEEEIVVTYYYKEVQRDVVITKVDEDGVTPLENAEFTLSKANTTGNSTSYITNANGKINLSLKAGEYILEEIDAPEGYEIPANNTQTITINKTSGNQDITIGNEKERGTVKVHYYIEGTETKVPTQSGGTVEDITKEGIVGEIYATSETENVHENYELVSIPDNSSGEYIDGEIVVTYYYKLKTSRVITHHYIEGTQTSISADVTVEKNVGETYTTSVANDIPEYYELVSEPTNKEGSVVLTDIHVYYYYRLKKYPYIVNYIDKDTNETIQVSKTVENITYGTEITAINEKINIPGYGYDSIDKEVLTIGTNNNVINIYYTKAMIGYTVEYYYDGVKNNDKTETLSAEYQSQISTYTDKNITGYKLEKTENLPLTITENAEDNIIKVYYVKDNAQTKEISFTVEYYKNNEIQVDDTEQVKETVQVLADDTLNVDKSSINVIDKYPGYIFEKTDPTEIPDTISNGGVIKVYYVKAKYPYSIEYYYDNVKDDTATEEGNAYKGTVIDSYTNKVKSGYEFEEVVGLPLVISDTEENIIKVYYLPIRKITINHIDKNSGEIIQIEEKTGKDGYTITTESLDIPGYTIVEKPATEEYTYIEEDQVVNYYYAKVSSGVLEKHIDLTNNKPIADDKSYEGYAGKAYTTASKDIAGYYIATNKDYYTSLIEKDSTFLSTAGVDTIEEYYELKNLKATDPYIPENYTGTMTEGLIEVRYYYVPTTKLIVRYIDITTGEEIVKQVDGKEVITTIEKAGKYDEEYTTKLENFDKYLPITNEMYYTKYFNDNPNALEELNINTVEEYLTKNNIDADANYIPENANGKLGVIINPDGTYSNETIVTYYYSVEREVIVRYYDQNTGKEISQEVVEVGMDGEPYDLSNTEKEIEGYTLVAEPTSVEGIYQEENETRKYYYAKNTQIVVKYVDKETGEELVTEETVKGYVGKEYTTEEKEITGYNYISSTDNTSGEMTEEETEVIYYYSKEVEPTYSKYIINYIDIDTGKPIKESKEVSNKEVGTTIYAKAEIIDIEEYTFEKADKDSITIKDGVENVINLYYVKDGDKEEAKDNNETAKEQKVIVVPTTKDDTPTNIVKVSNTQKYEYLNQILGFIFIIVGSLIIIINRIKNKQKE